MEYNYFLLTTKIEEQELAVADQEEIDRNKAFVIDCVQKRRQ